jgi:hypothetical protein
VKNYIGVLVELTSIVYISILKNLTSCLQKLARFLDYISITVLNGEPYSRYCCKEGITAISFVGIDDCIFDLGETIISKLPSLREQLSSCLLSKLINNGLTIFPLLCIQ